MLDAIKGNDDDATEGWVAIQSLFFAPESTPERTVESNFEKDTCMNFMFQKDFQY